MILGCFMLLFCLYVFLSLTQFEGDPRALERLCLQLGSGVLQRAGCGLFHPVEHNRVQCIIYLQNSSAAAGGENGPPGLYKRQSWKPTTLG